MPKLLNLISKMVLESVNIDTRLKPLHFKPDVYLDELLDSANTGQVIWQPPSELKKRVASESEQVIDLFTESERVYLLPQTGFEMKNQIDMWTRTINQSIRKGVPPREIIQDLVDRNAEDMGRFVEEYIYQNLALNIPVKFGQVGGEKRFVPKNYGCGLYLDTITDQEREGATKSSIAKVEKFLTKAPIGSMAIVASPSGWSGMLHANGTMMYHGDSQTYIFRVNEDGALEAVTLRTDMTLEENEQLVEELESLGGNNVQFDQELEEQERIKNVVSSAVLLRGNQVNMTFEEVIDAIERVKGSPNAFEGSEKRGIEPRTFAEMVSTLSKLEDQPKLRERANELIKAHTATMQEEVLNLSPESLKQMAISIGKVILRILREESDPDSGDIGSAIPLARDVSYLTQPEKYVYRQDEEALMQLQQIGGCAGGACNISAQGGLNLIAGLPAPRATTMLVKENESFNLDCPFCNATKARVNGDTITCKNGCSGRKPSYIKVVA